MLCLASAQCQSSLALKALRLGAATTDGGSAFHLLLTRTLKVLRQTLETALGFSSFHSCPRVLRVGAAVKNFLASTSTPCRSTGRYTVIMSH